MRRFALLLSCFAFSGCALERPTGDVESCDGSLSIEEASPTVSTVTISSGSKVGQHLLVANAMILKSIMVRTQTTGLTSLKISITPMGWTELPEFKTPLKEFTVTTGLTTTATQKLWIPLPEPLELENLNPTYGTDMTYFVAFEPTGGSMTVDVGTRQYATTFRRAYRPTGGTYWDISDEQKAMTIGLSGDATCGSMAGL